MIVKGGSTIGEHVDLLPSDITAGLTLNRSITLPEFDPEEWTLSVIMRGPQAIDIHAEPFGQQYRLNVTADMTATWAPGTYWTSIRVSNGHDTRQIDELTVNVRPDLAAITDVYDGRNHAQRVLAAIEAVIEGRATKDQQGYTINNRSLSRTPIQDLLLLRDRYRNEVRRQKMAEKGQSLLGRPVLVRF